jgi:hypothetical protein
MLRAVHVPWASSRYNHTYGTFWLSVNFGRCSSCRFSFAGFLPLPLEIAPFLSLRSSSIVHSIFKRFVEGILK